MTPHMNACGRLKSRNPETGSALILTLLMLALMLTLVLYYVTLVRLETQLSGFSSLLNRSRDALDRAAAEAVWEMESRHEIRSDNGFAYLAATSQVEWVSTGGGGAVTGGLTLAEAEALGWPEPEEIVLQADRASWVISGDSNAVHSAYAWAVVPLNGTLDPQGLAGWDISHLMDGPSYPDGRVYFSPAEFQESFPSAAPVFVPGHFSRDRGWYDVSSGTWQTNVTVNTQTLSMHPLAWTVPEVQALFASLYPDRDHAALAAAFLDFREGKTLPADPEGITAVPVPLFNEVTASMTVRNLGDDLLEITHQLDLEIWNLYEGNVQPGNYEVPITPPLVAREPGSVDAEFASVDSDADWTFTAPGGEVEAAFAVLTMNVVAPRITKAAGQVLEVDWNLAGLTLERVGEGAVDRLPAGLRLEMPGLTIPPSGGVERVEAVIEVIDPALNHLTDMWVTATNQTLSAVNRAALNARGADYKSDGWIRWTPAGRSGEWQESWIGFLPLDEPWRSVDLFDADGQWWLRHTRPPEWEPGKWQRDRINPNSHLEEAFRAAFVGLDLEKWPGDPDVETIPLAKAQRMATDLAASFLLDEGANHRGDWTRALEAVLTADDADRHAAESVVQQTLDRFTANYSLYGLILWSEIRLPDGQVRSTHREGMLLWLDPRPDAEGRHGVKHLLRHPLY